MNQWSTLLIEAAVTGPLRHSPGRIALAVLAIALGVALGLAIHLINRAAADEISIAARALYGLADFSIEAPDVGFDEDLYPAIATTPGVAAASPVVEIEAGLIGARGTIDLLGVDGFRSRLLQPAFATLARPATRESSVLRPNAIYVSANLARELGLEPVDALKVQAGVDAVELTVAGVLPDEALRGRAGVVDIAFAQERFGRLGRLSRVDVRLESGVDVERVRALIEQQLPAGVRMTTPGAATDDALRLSRAYRSNLTALALVALFTGGFFVYSTQSLLALKRRRELAVLHALGMTRAQQLASVLAGSVLIGALGAALGVALGALVADVGVAKLGADLGAGFFRGLSPSLAPAPLEIASFAALGVGVAAAGAVRPALEAARIPTASALKAGDVTSAEAPVRRGFIAATLALAGAMLFLPSVWDLPLLGYGAIALLLIAAVASAPAIVRFATACAPALRSAPWQVAFAQIGGTARYASLSVASIIVSFGLMTSMAIMVTSFRDSLDAWTQRLLPADLYVRVGYVGQSSWMTPATADALAALPGVARAERTRFGQVQLADEARTITLIARPIDPEAPERTLWITHSAAGGPAEGVWPVWISEAVADLYAWRAGETRRIVIAGRTVEAYAQGVWRDYEHQGGAVVMRYEDYVRLTGDRRVNTVWLWLEENASLTDVQARVHEAFPEGGEYDLRTPAQIRRQSLAAFDRTFAVTYLLELVAVLIGLFGIASGVSAQVLARRGEFGALRHIGFTRGQVGAMLAIEGALLGAVGVVVGLIAGGLVSFILIYVVNRQSFHWSMDLSAPAGLLAGLSLALIASSAAIALAAGRGAMSGDVVGAVREDW